MLSRRTVRLIFFALALLLGVTAGVAQRKAAAKNRTDFMTEWTLILTKPFLLTARSVAGEYTRIAGVFRTNSSLKRENERLKLKLVRFERAANSQKEAISAKTRYESLLQFRNSIPSKTVTARIIVRPGLPWEDTCSIDRGYLDYVKPGAAVMSHVGLIGQVTELGERTSRVILLTSPQNSVACFVQRNRVPGICTGRGEALLQMEYIPLGADVAVGDPIVTSGEGEVYPGGILVGYVVQVETLKHAQFKTAYVRPAVEFRSIEEALVVVSKR